MIRSAREWFKPCACNSVLDRFTVIVEKKIKYPYEVSDHLIFQLYIPRIFLAQKLIYGYFLEHECIFCEFYDAVNTIHDVITTANLFPCTAKFMFVDVRNNKTQQVRDYQIKRIRI